jgi:prepilin-type N-terminal cleavage/methylation domain-containing protein
MTSNRRPCLRRSAPFRQHGFSLLETAVVLFLIALLVSSTLHGREMASMTQVRQLAEDFHAIPTAIHVYKDRFRALPGDDLLAATHLGRADLVAGNGNGRIDGRWTDTAATSESARVWQQLRLAGIIAAGPTDTAAMDYLPRNALGYPLGLQSATADPAQTPIRDGAGQPMPGAYIVCTRGVPGRLAQMLDSNIDDGDPAAGSMLATPDTGSAYAPGAAAVTRAGFRPETGYIVCRST